MTTVAASSSSISHEPAALLPLPLVPFERYLLEDDSPQFPMTFSGEFFFREPLDRGLLQQALRDVLPRHPLLRATVVGSGKRATWCAVPQPAELPWVDLPPTEQGTCLPALNVRRTPGVRIAWRDLPDGTHVIWEFHHVACDGHGGMRFVEDLLVAYANLVAGDPSLAQLPPLDPRRLLGRDQYEPGQPRPGSTRAQILQPLREAWNFHTQRIMPLAVPPPEPPASRLAIPYPGTLTHILSAEASAHIRAQVRQSGGTLNDVGLGLLFLSLAEWNQRFDAFFPRRWLRILIPMNLRDRGDRTTPAANRTGFCFVARRERDLQDWNRLLAGLQEETNYYKRCRVALDFLAGLKAIQQVPGLLPRLLRWQGCVSTAVLTNLADPTRFLRRSVEREGKQLRVGNSSLAAITGSSTIRNQTYANFGLGLYDERLILTLRCDAARFSLPQGRQLLLTYVRAFERWAGLPETVDERPLRFTRAES